MSQSLNWDDFRLIRAIADSGALTGAADALGLNHSTVFRRLGALEEQLSLRLFERARAGYAPTAAGEEMVALARRMGDDIVDFERKVAGRDIRPSGELRVTTNDSMVGPLLAPIFAGFLKAFPEVRLETIVVNQALNLSRRDADVAIRATDAPPETLVGRRVAAIAWARYGSPTLIAEWPDPDDPRAPWIGYGGGLANVPAVKRLNERVPAHRIIYRTSTVIGQAEAVAAGIGFAEMPCFVADRAPGIVRVGPADLSAGRSLWVLTHPDLRQSARVRAFTEYVGAELTKRRKWLEGV